MGYALQLKTTKSGEWQLILLWFFPIWLRIKDRPFLSALASPNLASPTNWLCGWFLSFLGGSFLFSSLFLPSAKKPTVPIPRWQRNSGQWVTFWISKTQILAGPIQHLFYTLIFVQFFFWNFVVMNLLTWSLGSTVNEMMKGTYMWWWFSTIFLIKYAVLCVLLVN